jgi:ElaB/YqjD/DUF883 family membrane-anchored ribosome-binding protein
MQRARDAVAATEPGIGAGPSMSDTPSESGLLPPPATEGERFFEDLKAFVADTGALLQQARTLSGEGALAAREEFEHRLVRAREGLYTAQSRAMDRMVDWRDRTERYMRDEPWTAVGVAAAAGFVIGLLSRRGSR